MVFMQATALRFVQPYRWQRRFLLPLFIVLLAGCQTTKTPPSAPIKAPLAPLATHTFSFDPERDSVVGELQVTEAGADDTLSDIARRFNIGYEEIVRANPGVDPWLPKAGTRIVLPTQFILPDGPRSGIVINLAALRLFYYPPRKDNEPQTVITHPIGIGMVGWTTPLGSTKVVGKRANPWWYPPSSVRKEHAEDGDPLPAKVPPGPDNPLGKYAIALGWPSYFIHGTNQPYGVGIRASHGCIRMYPEDIALLYDDIPLGTRVVVVNQPTLYGHRGEQLYFQTFPIFEDYPKPKTAAVVSRPVVAKAKNAGKKIVATRDKTAKKKTANKTIAPQQIALNDNGPVKTDAGKNIVAPVKNGAVAAGSHAANLAAAAKSPLVAELSKYPRGIAVAVTTSAGTLDSYLANIRLVENRLPAQATWDGVE